MSQSKNSEALSPALRAALFEGVSLFNQAEYGPAHESWERVWRESNDPDKTHLKALIQVCGIFHLIQERRFDPALRLCQRSLELFAESEAHFQLHARQPLLQIPGVEDVVIRIAASLKCGMKDADWFLELARNLKAQQMGESAEAS
jgi:hypothetical protein